MCMLICLLCCLVSDVFEGFDTRVLQVISLLPCHLKSDIKVVSGG